MANSNARIARLGVNAVEGIVVRDLGWIFREQPTDDYGIDAHIEICEDGQPTGRLIAAQVKSGESWFKWVTEEGYRYRGSFRHLRYWTSHSLPVILVLYNPAVNAAWWVPVESDRVEKLSDGWKIVVPLGFRLGASSADQLRPLAIPDYRKRRDVSAVIGRLGTRANATSAGLGRLLDALQTATESLDLVFPYVDAALFWVVKSLSHRVRVRLVTGPTTTPEVADEYRHIASEDPNFEVRIFPPPDGRNRLHDKFVILDGIIAIYGSANLTQRSWRRQFEIVLAADDATVVANVRRSFDTFWTMSMPTGKLP